MSGRIVFVAALAAAACGPSSRSHNGTGDGGTDAAPQPHTLEGISVTPTNPIVQLDLNATGQQAFAASAVYADGSSDDVTAQVTWAVANPAVGAMTGATLTIPAFGSASASVSTITATYANGSATLTGQAQITVVAYRQTGPQQDFFFILPYEGSAAMKPLDFSTAVPALDVFFLEDTTGSMGGEIANIQTAMTGTIIPGIQAAVTNAQFGVGAFDDFPVDGDSTANGGGIGADGTLDQPLKLRQAVTPTISLVQTAVNGLTTGGGSPIGNGGDIPEAGIEALYQVATGAGLTGPSPTSVPANHAGVGGVGFRAGTMPVIVSISDASSHTNGADPNNPSCGDSYASDIDADAHTNAQTVTALNAICARVVGIAPVNGTCDAENYYTAFATATGARVPPAAWSVGTRPAGCSVTQCCTGQNGAGMATDANGLCPLVFRASTSGTGVSTSVVTGINMLTRFATFDVTRQIDGLGSDTSGNPLPPPHTTADFLKAVTPASFMLPPPPPSLPDPTIDTATQGFDGVTPGTTVTFTVDALNDFVQQTAQPQIFKATIQVLAGGCTALDQREVLILVPPMPIGIL